MYFILYKIINAHELFIVDMGLWVLPKLKAKDPGLSNTTHNFKPLFKHITEY